MELKWLPKVLQALEKQISNSLGENYLPEKPRVFKNKAKNAQEAHECIRPTDFSQTPENAKTLNKSELDLYALIWRSFGVSIKSCRGVADDCFNFVLLQKHSI